MRISTRLSAATRRATFIRRILEIRRPAAGATILIALLGLLASVELGPVSHFTGVQVGTHPITVLGLMTLGGWGLWTNRFGPAHLVRGMVLGAVLMICVARIMVAGMALWVQTADLPLFGPSVLSNSAFETPTALALCAFATAALMRRHQGRLGTAFLVAGLGVVYYEVVKLGLGAPFGGSGLGAFTVLGLVSAALMMVSIYVHRPLVRAAFLMGDLGDQTRIMAAVVVAVPLLGGFAAQWGRSMGADTVPVQAGITTLVTFALLLGLLGTTARLESTAGSRRRADLALALKRRTDPVTKSLTRLGMMEALEGAWLDYRATGKRYGLVLLDLNQFERINETFGHQGSDTVLARLSDTLKNQLRDSDAMGRWGGGEFLLLLRIKRESDLEIVTARLDRVLSDVESPLGAGLSGGLATLTASFGVSVMEDRDHGPAEAITRADVDLSLRRAVPFTAAKTRQVDRQGAAA